MDDRSDTNEDELDVSWYPTSIEELHELLTFYRKQAIVFKRERTEYENILKSLEMSNEEKHKLEWNLHEKTQLNEALKKQLSDTHILLYKEKNSNIELNSEIKSLNAEINELKQNKNHLLSLLQSANNNINTIMNDYGHGADGKCNKSHNKRCKACNIKRMNNIAANLSHTHPSKLTTIYLPADNSETFETKLAAKDQELKDLKQESIKINEYLMNDRNKAYESLDTLRTEYDDKFKSLQKEMAELSQQHVYNLKAYLNYRRNTKQEIHDLQINLFQIKQENNKMKQKYNQKYVNIKKNTNKMEKELKKKSTKLIHGFRMETMRKHEELNNVKDELKTLTKSYQFDVKNLKHKLNKTQRKNKRLNQINKCQKIGIQTDVDQLKKRLHKLQQNMNHLRLNDDSNSSQISLQNEINKIKQKLMELAKITEA